MNKKRVLVVNAHFDDRRAPSPRPTTVLRAAGPPFLAGALEPATCDVALWDEQTQGPLEDRARLGWPDLLVLTGLTNAFDRMRHLTAYARTLNPRVIVAAGGSAVRAIPRHAARFFDYACTGDVEELADVAADALGPEYARHDLVPRFDLAPWIGRFGHVETSRNCNFRCNFCTLTGEGGRYSSYSADAVRAQFEALGPRPFAIFIDNNFHGVRGAAFRARLDLVDEMRRRGFFRNWAALVTSDFFADAANVERARETGCTALYCGVESFRADAPERFAKPQNARNRPHEIVRCALDAGIVLTYGLVLDPGSRAWSDIEAELDEILCDPELPLPSMLTLAIPYPRTPLFDEYARERRLLPRTKLRDLDGKTLCVRPLDPLERVADGVARLQTLRGRRVRAIRHSFATSRRYRGSLSARQRLMMAARDADHLGLFRAFDGWLLPHRAPARTHVSTSERLDACYRPALPVDARFASWFEPTFLTDDGGEITAELAPDLSSPRASIAPATTSRVARSARARAN